MMIVNGGTKYGYVPVFADAAGRKFIFMRDEFDRPVAWAHGHTWKEAIEMGRKVSLPEGCCFLQLAAPMMADITGIGAFAQRGNEFLPVLIVDSEELNERIRNQ